MYNDPSGMDGVYTGTGTKEDPYVIQANYYYSGLNEVEEKAFKDAIAEYTGKNEKNPEGKVHEIKIDKKNKVYVKFDLVEVNFDAIQQENDEPFTIYEIAYKDAYLVEKDPKNEENITNYYTYGHVVALGNVDKPNKFSSSNNQNIIFDRAASERFFSKYPGDGTQYSDFTKGVFIHEIGHTLTAVHGDPGSIMKYAYPTATTNSNTVYGNNRTGKFQYNLPRVTNDGIRAIIGRLGQNHNTVGWESKYLTDKERKEKNYLDKVESKKGINVYEETNSRIMRKPQL